MGEMRDTGWQPASDVQGAFWRELRGNGRGARIHVFPSGAWNILQAGSTWDDSPDVDSAMRDALQHVVNAILHDELAAGVSGDVPEWAARLAAGWPVRPGDAGIVGFAPGSFGPFPPFHYP